MFKHKPDIRLVQDFVLKLMAVQLSKGGQDFPSHIDSPDPPLVALPVHHEQVKLKPPFLIGGIIRRLRHREVFEVLRKYATFLSLVVSVS